MTSVVLALDFGGTKIAAAVADLSGRRLSETTVPTDAPRGAQWNLDRALAAARDLLEGRRPAAVAASTFGIPSADGVLLAPAIDGWEGLPLGRELATALGCDRVRLVTDVKAAAAAEAKAGALVGSDPAVYLNLGTGLAVAILVHGEVLVGANGAAGEIGYNRVRAGDGRVLEQVMSGVGLAVGARERLGTDLTAAEVLARADESELSELVADAVDELCFHVVNLAVAIDPARIAVGGGMVGSWERFDAPLRRALDRTVPFPPELVPAAFPFDAPLRGAIALAVEAAGTESEPPA